MLEVEVVTSPDAEIAHRRGWFSTVDLHAPTGLDHLVYVQQTFLCYLLNELA